MRLVRRQVKAGTTRVKDRPVVAPPDDLARSDEPDETAVHVSQGIHWECSGSAIQGAACTWVPRAWLRAPVNVHSMTNPGSILLISCYELGHQPLGIAWPQGFLARAGLAADTLDLAVEPWDDAKIRRATLVAIAVPMHTALRLGVRAARRIRKGNPHCRIAFLGLYAVLNADYLLDGI